jgi:hypothetical protein
VVLADTVARVQRARVALFACVGAFVALIVPAMALYPGGTWWEPQAIGHRFWSNFLCDLEWRTALNGTPNPVGARLAEGAMLSLVLAFVPFWPLAARLFARRSRLASTVRLLGWTSVVGMIAVALMPSERFGALHGVAVVIAGLPGLSAALLAATGQLLARRMVPGVLGATMAFFAVLDFLLYVHTMLHGGPGPLVLPAVQKAALLLLLAWMLVVGAEARSDVTETQAVP